MKKIEFEDYKRFFEKYVNNFKNHRGIQDICWCGTLNDPGVSDIDIILVIDSWEKFDASYKILNPERISPLFYHGPLICNKKYFREFFQFTNVKIFKNLNEQNFEIYKQINTSKFDIFVRQCFYILNFKDYNFNQIVDRSQLLDLSSILHSLRELEKFNFINNELVIKEIKNESNILRNKYKHNNYNKFKISNAEEISEKLIYIIKKAEISLIEYLNFEILKDNNDTNNLATFVNELLLNEPIIKTKINQNYKKNIEDWQNLLQDNIYGNIISNSFIKGADFILSNDFLRNKIGFQIWLRRLIKKILIKVI